MDFIGRESELKFLQDKYNENKAQLIFLYGRRRVGKTETLREFCKDKPHIFISCTESSDNVQLLKFSQCILKEDIVSKKYVTEFSNWEKAFRAILELPYGDKKKLVVIDEFPYMCKGNKSIPSILQNLWDIEFKDQNVMIILCGSALSFIEKDLLAEKNPLYGRATGIYKMKPLGFYDAIRFFPNYSDQDKIFAYSILGGIPHYLKQFDPNLSIEENVKRNILTKGSILYSEVDFLLHQELREISVYNSIIEAIALGSTKLNDISQKSLINDTSKTSVYLKNLIELGIVERIFSVDTKTKEESNTSRGIYVLTDNFFRFWYAFGFTNLSLLEDGDINGVYKHFIKPSLSEFVSYNFEDVCKQFISELQKEDLLPFHYTRIGKWFGKTTVRDNKIEGCLRSAETEIDLLALSKNEKEYLVGECKFKNKPFNYTEYLEITAKLLSLQKNAKFFYALFSLTGFDEKVLKQSDSDDNLYLYNIETIVNFRDNKKKRRGK